MKATLKLVEKIKSKFTGSINEIYVLNLETKVRGEKNAYTSRTYGVTVSYLSDSHPVIFHKSIYNMVTGETRFVKSIERIVLDMIKKGNFTKASYYKEYES